MTQFEYKIVPAPTKGIKAKGIKTPQDRFANALETVMNDMGAQGWEYQRADTLPSEERAGLTGRVTTFHHMLVFRRALETQDFALPIVAPYPDPEMELPAVPVVTKPVAPVEAPSEQAEETPAADEDTAATSNEKNDIKDGEKSTAE